MRIMIHKTAFEIDIVSRFFPYIVMAVSRHYIIIDIPHHHHPCAADWYLKFILTRLSWCPFKTTSFLMTRLRERKWISKFNWAYVKDRKMKTLHLMTFDVDLENWIAEQFIALYDRKDLFFETCTRNGGLVMVIYCEGLVMSRSWLHFPLFFFNSQHSHTPLLFVPPPLLPFINLWSNERTKNFLIIDSLDFFDEIKESLYTHRKGALISERKLKKNIEMGVKS